MSDAELRRLARDPSAAAELLERRLRAGELSEPGLRLAAALGAPELETCAAARRWTWQASEPCALAERVGAALLSAPLVEPVQRVLGPGDLLSRDVESGVALHWAPRAAFPDATLFWAGCLAREGRYHGDWAFVARLAAASDLSEAWPPEAGPGPELLVTATRAAERKRALVGGALEALPLDVVADVLTGPRAVAPCLVPLRAWNERAWVYAFPRTWLTCRWHTSA